MSSSRVALVGAALLVAAVGGFGGGIAIADDGDGDGSSIGVTVVDDTPSPTPIPSSSNNSGGSGSGGSGSSGSGGSGSGGSGSGGGTPPPPGSGGTPTPSPTPGGTDGWIVMSGIDPSPQTELNPFRGWVRVVVSVANRSSTIPVSGAIVFRMYTAFGTQIGPSVTQQVARIPPGEVRQSTATLPGVGQWTFVRVTAEFTPRGPLKDVGPISRETWVFVLPWLLLAIAVILVAAGIIVRLRRRSS
ncbi:MAG: hypothetical protein ABIQ01_02590 [Pseudolysinimonas sp.]